jgi:hypothetical protein
MCCLFACFEFILLSYPVLLVLGGKLIILLFFFDRRVWLISDIRIEILRLCGFLILVYFMSRVQGAEDGFVRLGIEAVLRFFHSYIQLHLLDRVLFNIVANVD